MRLFGEATDRAHGRETRSVPEPGAHNRIRQGAQLSRDAPEASRQLDPGRSDHQRLEQSLDRSRPPEAGDEKLLRERSVECPPLVTQRQGTRADHDTGRRRERIERPQAPTHFRSEKLDVPLRSRWKDWPVEGLLVHAAGEGPNGFRVVDVWESEEAARRFGEKLAPHLEEAGITAEPEVYETHAFVYA